MNYDMYVQTSFATLKAPVVKVGQYPNNDSVVKITWAHLRMTMTVAEARVFSDTIRQALDESEDA